MTDPTQSEQAAKRILHIRAHLDKGFTPEIRENAIKHIRAETGNPHGCALTLSSHAFASAMNSWYERRDLDSMRQWFGVAARLDRFAYQIRTDTRGPGGNMLRLLKPLLSNEASVIEWFACYDAAFDLQRVENHKTHDFWAYQAVVALRGEWPRLIERCEKVLADPPGASAEQKYLRDHNFFLSLARGDKQSMERALEEMVSPTALKSRSNDESGYSEDLISTPAVIYAKIGWIHGHQVQPVSPYLPLEWMPMTPLARYEKRYDFLT